MHVSSKRMKKENIYEINATEPFDKSGRWCKVTMVKKRGNVSYAKCSKLG